MFNNVKKVQTVAFRPQKKGANITGMGYRKSKPLPQIGSKIL